MEKREVPTYLRNTSFRNQIAFIFIFVNQKKKKKSNSTKY